MTIWRMRIACWIIEAVDTHSEYVILIAFPLQQWLHERALLFHYTFTDCLVHILTWRHPNLLHYAVHLLAVPGVRCTLVTRGIFNRLWTLVKWTLFRQYGWKSELYLLCLIFKYVSFVYQHFPLRLPWLRVFPCFFLSCKANVRVKLAKTGHGPHSSTLVCIYVVRLLFVLFCVLFVCKCVLPLGDNPTAVNKIYIISRCRRSELKQ